MDSSEAMRLRAKDFERSDQLRPALDLYLRLADDPRLEMTAALWTRIGDLQLLTAEPEAAAASHARAVDRFIDAGQPNNAIAVCFRLMANGAASDLSIRLKFGELAISQGYRVFAREAIGDFSRRTAELGRAQEALGAIDAYLQHFPDETELWREWIAEILTLGGKPNALHVLRHLREHFAERGDHEAAARVSDRIAHLSLRDPDRRSESATPPDSAAASGLNLLGGEGPNEGAKSNTSTPSAGGRGADLEIVPLAGLEPTHIGFGRTKPGAEDEPEPLPLIERSSSAPRRSNFGSVPEPAFAPRGAGESEPAEQGADEAKPLPLLQPSEESRAATPGAAAASKLPSDSLADRTPSEQETASVEPSSLREPLASRSGSAARVAGHGSTAPSSRADEHGTFPAAEDPHQAAAGAAPRLHSSTRTAAAELRRIAPKAFAPAEASVHFELGTTFRQMGLLEDSLARFAAALEGGHQPLPVLAIVAEILLGRGDHRSAHRLLSAYLEADEKQAEEVATLRYWLARCEEADGNHDAARSLLEAVLAADGTFRDAAERLRGLAPPPFDTP